MSPTGPPRPPGPPKRPGDRRPGAPRGSDPRTGGSSKGGTRTLQRSATGRSRPTARSGASGSGTTRPVDPVTTPRSRPPRQVDGPSQEAGGTRGQPGALAALAPRTERAPRRPDLRVVRPARHLRTGLVGGLLVSIVFVTLFLLAAMQAVLVQGQLHLDQLQGDVAQREQDRDRLELQVNTLESPDRLAQAATALGMVPAPQVMFLYADPAAAGEAPRGPLPTPDTLVPTPTTTPPADASSPPTSTVGDAGSTATDASTGQGGTTDGATTENATTGNATAGGAVTELPATGTAPVVLSQPAAAG